MAVTPYTEDDLRTIIRGLEAGLSGFVSGTSFQFRSVTYRSTDEILVAIRYFEALLLALSGRGKQTLVVSRKGFSVGRFW